MRIYTVRHPSFGKNLHRRIYTSSVRKWLKNTLKLTMNKNQGCQ